MNPFVIMADIDGPLATARAGYATGDRFDPVACAMLARVCIASGAKLVITSARRRNDNLPAELARHGLMPHLFSHPDHWRTGFRADGVRGDEIDDWHAVNPGHDYAILDDERGGLHPHHLPRLVHVDMHAGMSIADMLRLQRLMGHQVTDKDIGDDRAQTPRITLAQMARDAIQAIDQGDDNSARMLLDRIANHPLAQ